MAFGRAQSMRLPVGTYQAIVCASIRSLCAMLTDPVTERRSSAGIRYRKKVQQLDDLTRVPGLDLIV